MEQESRPVSFYIHEVSYDLEQEAQLSQWLQTIAKDHNKPLANLEYVICSDEYLLEINKAYLNHDYYTDIITFPLNEDPLEATIYISLDRVEENAKAYQISSRDELHRVIAHGLLHLLGYQDKTEAEQKEMRTKENSCLQMRNFI